MARQFNTSFYNYFIIKIASKATYVHKLVWHFGLAGMLRFSPPLLPGDAPLLSSLAVRLTMSTNHIYFSHKPGAPPPIFFFFGNVITNKHATLLPSTQNIVGLLYPFLSPNGRRDGGCGREQVGPLRLDACHHPRGRLHQCPGISEVAQGKTCLLVQ